MNRYRAYVDGKFIGSELSKNAAQALILEAGEKLPAGSDVSFQLKLGKEVVGEGRLEVEAYRGV
ncbi:MAG: hypothetical protein ACREYA_15785 [Cupriavidus necator]